MEYNVGSDNGNDDGGGSGDNVDSDNYCPFSVRSNPYDSSKSNVKEWCNIPDF